LDVLARVEVIYETFEGWKTSIASISSFDALPETCKKYIAYIEAFLNVRIEWIGVGPERESMIKQELKPL
jgi:adenylosuccinate synthase